MTIKEVVNYSRDSESFCEAYSIVNADAIVCGALKLEERNMKDLKPEILYVMSYQKMPKALPGNATYNFLILVPDKEMPLQIPEVVRTRCNLLIAESSIDRAMLAVQNIIFDEWRIESSIRLLTEALFTSGITRMLSVGAEQLQCSIILVEQFGKVIEKSEGLKSIPPGTKFAEFWKKEDFSDFLEKVDDDFYPQEDIQQYMRFSDMKVFRVEDIEKQIIAQPVRISRVEIGKLFVFFDERELNVFDGELVYRLALILGDELRRRNVFKIRHRKRYLNFMWMLLEDKYPNHQVIERAMEELEIDFKGKCCVAVIHAISEKDVAASQNDALNVLSARSKLSFRM